MTFLRATTGPNQLTLLTVLSDLETDASRIWGSEALGPCKELRTCPWFTNRRRAPTYVSSSSPAGASHALMVLGRWRSRTSPAARIR